MKMPGFALKKNVGASLEQKLKVSEKGIYRVLGEKKSLKATNLVCVPFSSASSALVASSSLLQLHVLCQLHSGCVAKLTGPTSKCSSFSLVI